MYHILAEKTAWMPWSFEVRIGLQIWIIAVVRAGSLRSGPDPAIANLKAPFGACWIT